jgi:hypothetical protein
MRSLTQKTTRSYRFCTCTQAFVLVFTLMLVAVITVADYLVGHHLNSKLPFHIPESGVTMFIGMLLGAFISALGELIRLQLALCIILAVLGEAVVSYKSSVTAHRMLQLLQSQISLHYQNSRHSLRHAAARARNQTQAHSSDLCMLYTMYCITV